LLVGTKLDVEDFAENGKRQMTRYFFDLNNGDGFTEDLEGRDLPDMDAVHKEVAAIVTDLAGDELNGTGSFKAKVTVRDESGKTVFEGVLSYNGE
jgi:hypothetical protein